MISKLQVAAPLGFGGVASLGSHQEAIGQLPPPLSPGNEGPDILIYFSITKSLTLKRRFTDCHLQYKKNGRQRTFLLSL